MADLPADRMANIAPYTHVGIDMAGPWYVFTGKTTRRTSASKKVWILIVTCLASRAIHIEVVPAMDTASFELALRRFIALRGTCVLIRSDQGSNFIGAISSTPIDFSKLQRFAASHNISWELNPPYASNYGGVYERKLGALKSILTATLKLTGRYHVSMDEFATLIQESASVVNNTPLWSVSSDPADPCPLSPANIITLKDNPNPAAGEYSESDLLEFGKRRWRRVMYLADQFWTRWRNYYLHSLQERRRWKTPNHNISRGDIVLLRGKGKRNEWPMGVIYDVKVGSDGLIRRVWVNVPIKGGVNHVLERSVRDTVLLIPKMTHASTGEYQSPTTGEYLSRPTGEHQSPAIGEYQSRSTGEYNPPTQSPLGEAVSSSGDFKPKSSG